MNDNTNMISSPEPDDFLSDKISYTRSWQQGPYLLDSGINSALETHAPSVSSKHGYDDMDSDYGVSTNNKSVVKNEQSSGGGVGGNSSKLGSITNDVFSNDMCLLTPETPNSMQCYKSSQSVTGPGEASTDVLSMSESVKKEDLASIKSTSELDINIDKLEVESAMPDLVNLIKDEDDAVILNEATRMIFELSKSDAIESLINSDEMISCIIEAIDKADHADAVRFLAGVIYNMSQKKHGLKVIFEKNVIPCLVKLLGFTMESVLFYAITTLHNLLLYQEGGKEAIRLSGCIPKMVALLQKNNIKFLTICTDCLQILAFNHQQSKIEILKNGGPLHLIHIIKTYDYEKLLWTATRVIKVLSVCSANKPVIIREGGVEALTNILYHTIQKSNSSNLSSTYPSTSVTPSTNNNNNNNPNNSNQSESEANANTHATSSSSSSTTSSAPQFSQRLLHNCLWTLRNLSDAASRLNFDNLLKVLTDILINASNSFARQNYQIDTNAVTCAAGILSNLTCNNQFNKMNLFKNGGVEAILRTIEWNLVIMTSNNPAIRLSNSYHPEELLEPCICALRHISSRHDQAEPAQSSIIQNQGLCVLIKLMEIQLGPDLYHMQTHQSVPPNLFVSYYNINWNLIKAIIGLIRNLGMSPCNFMAIREKGFVWPMIVLINRAQIDLFNRTQNGNMIPRERLLEEIIEVGCGALHMLAKDPGIRAQILSIKLWQRLINSPQQIGVQPALYVIANLILSYPESVQRFAVGLLSELSAERYGLDLIMNQPIITTRLNEMVHSNNEALCTYASAIFIKVSEEKDKRYNNVGGPPPVNTNYMPSTPGNLNRNMVPQGGVISPNNSNGGGGYLNSILTCPPTANMHCGPQQQPPNVGGPINNMPMNHHHHNTMSPSSSMVLTSELLHDIPGDMDVVPDYSPMAGTGGQPSNGPPSSMAAPRYCSPPLFMDSGGDMMSGGGVGGPPSSHHHHGSSDYGSSLIGMPGGGRQQFKNGAGRPIHSNNASSNNSYLSNNPGATTYKPNMTPGRGHPQTKESGGTSGSTTNSMDVCMSSGASSGPVLADADWMEGCWSPSLDPK